MSLKEQQCVFCVGCQTVFALECKWHHDVEASHLGGLGNLLLVHLFCKLGSKLFPGTGSMVAMQQMGKGGVQQFLWHPNSPLLAQSVECLKLAS